MLMRFCIVPVVLAFFAAAPGCAPNFYFAGYAYGGAEVDSPLLGYQVAVEVSALGIREAADTNGWAFGLIPLMPCGWQAFKSPESLMHSYRKVRHSQWRDKTEPDDAEVYYPYELGLDLAETIQYDLKSSNLFRDVRFAYEGKYCAYGEKDVERYYPAVLFSIEVAEMTWYRYPTFYGVSMAGAIGWVIGLPVSYGTCRLVLEVEAVDVKHDETLWEKEYVAEPICVEWIYSNWGAGKSWCAALKQIMTEMRGDLVENIPEFERKMAEFEREAEKESEEESEDDW
ncbi:MAG: hypothetical protein E3J72_00615 [Planctomycetota bacterium]|nr:MAG: hypothetical protein E3J72_00615 [Planctomycetota bacterium]